MRSWKGTIIGGLLGLLFFGNIITAAIGGLIGYFFVDKQRNIKMRNDAEANYAFTKGANYNQNLVHHTFALMGYVARGAGRVNRQHISTAERYMHLMQLDEHSKKMAIEAFNYGKSAEFDLKSLTDNLRAMSQGNLSLISYLLEIQVQMVLSDGSLEPLEHERLINIATMLGIKADAMERLIRQRVAELYFSNYFKNGGTYSHSENEGYNHYQNNGESAPRSKENDLLKAYEVLGVDKDAPFEDINRAYKRLMLKYHPDRLKSQNLSPELVKVYEEKAKDIQAAYDLIKRSKR